MIVFLRCFGFVFLGFRFLRVGALLKLGGLKGFKGV